MARYQFHLRFLFVVLFVLSVAAVGQPKHVYLTYSDDPATSIDINLLIVRKSPGVSVYWDSQPHNGEKEKYAHCTEATYYKTVLEILDRRALYVAALKNLAPGQTYYFIAGDEKNGFSEEKSFRTMRGGMAPFRFVTGGDMNIYPRTEKLAKLAGEQDPDFVAVGGDLPYANGLFAEYNDWDEWFRIWNTYIVGRDGRMIPIVAAIGNHEVNSYESDNIELRSPFFVSLFGRQGESIYFSRKLSDYAVLFVLDTGHLFPHDGAQLDWLKTEFEKFKDVKYKFALYHVPLYPTHRPYEGPASVAGRTYWGPLFDQYGLTVGFENHDHVFKRSKPLRGNQVVRKGTVYVGDGTFGVEPRTVDPQPRWYNEKEGSIAHFWVVDVTPKKVSLKAIDEDGKTIDAFSVR
ncbi:MAG TPA: metallophosphoesterase family protein [Candidatus Hydrogenedentes bacterium]|nr:metallophosphoesterase family protein [Candidatus Hydrogenedentota bacterium]HOL76414.1 metallophosphoesterase family protein [Candidatus Hydrogenedentota bacterium]HPO85452.1 metallophosphoesterase family protein [Candidatus Hydrogenedentota bacterium]